MDGIRDGNGTQIDGRQSVSGLTQDQLRAYLDDGYLVIEDLFPALRLDGLVHELNGVIDEWADVYHQEGRLDEVYAGEPFEKRLRSIHLAMGDFPELLSAVLGKRKTPAMFDALTMPEILDAVESVIGPEILVHPQFNSRAKMPDGMSVVGWHQDMGFLNEDVADTFMVNFWVPLVDSDRQNGCLEVIPGSHKVGLLPFEQSPEDIVPASMPTGEPVCCPVPRGGVLMIQHRTVHRSTPNYSDGIRWSLDIRYSPIGKPTGRPDVPGFVARSVERPEEVCTGIEDWLTLFSDR